MACIKEQLLSIRKAGIMVISAIFILYRCIKMLKKDSLTSSSVISSYGILSTLHESDGFLKEPYAKKKGIG